MANSDSSGVISFIFFLIFAMLGPRCSSVVAAWALQFQHELSRPEACGILVPQPGIEPASLALEKVKVARSCLTFVAPRTIQSMEFSQPEYWSG